MTSKRNIPTRRFIKPTFEFLIEKKRDGGEFTQEEIRYIIDSTLDGEMPQHQLSALMMAISEHVKANGLNQTEAAKLFAVSQPRISDLMRGKIGMFSIDTLVEMLATAGIQVDIRVRLARTQTLTLPRRRTATKPVRQRVAA